MHWWDRVAWAEGMFLQPHHLQQHTRACEAFTTGRVRNLIPYGWGFSRLQVDTGLLEQGMVGLLHCRGVLPDGTPFDVPESTGHPPPVAVTDQVTSAMVYLAIPPARVGQADVARQGMREEAGRYSVAEYEAPDSSGQNAAAVSVQVQRLQLQLIVGKEDADGFIRLPIARIVEKRGDQKVVLDPGYIPPLMACDASQILSSFLDEIEGIISQRLNLLAGRASQIGTASQAGILDALMLVTLNRTYARVRHMASLPDLHPAWLYGALSEAASELQAFRDSRRAVAYPDYDHEDIAACLAPILLDMRLALTEQVDRNVIPLDLIAHPRVAGAYRSIVPDQNLLEQARFILTVKTSLRSEDLRRAFPHQITVAPPERLGEFVKAASRGVTLMPLQTPPPEMQHFAGFVYFELDRNDEMWSSLVQARSIGFHLADRFPDLVMEFWAIKR